jgi:Cytochrome oxidase assembly protein
LRSRFTRRSFHLRTANTMLGRMSAFGRTVVCTASNSFSRGAVGFGVRGWNLEAQHSNAPDKHRSAMLSTSWRGAQLGRTFGKQQAVEIDLNDTIKLQEMSVKGRLVHPGHEKKVGYWLLLCAGAVFGMIILGGYTRLSKSGLSMVRWKPIEYSYPRSQAQWEEEFEHYKVDLGLTVEIPRVSIGF